MSIVLISIVLKARVLGFIVVVVNVSMTIMSGAAGSGAWGSGSVVSKDMVSGAIVLVSTVSKRSCRGLWWEGGCCEMRVDVKKMIGGGYGGVNGRYCGPIEH